MAKTNRTVVIADWLFTTPTLIVQPITELWLVHIMRIPLDQPWIIATLVLYVIAGGCWVPVVWLQIRMRDLATEALTQERTLDERHHRYARIWFWLGIPAFTSMAIIYFLMVFKPNVAL